MAEVRLKAVDLLSKSGFDDGNLLDDILDDGGYDITAPLEGEPEPWETKFGAAVLCECIRRHLAPMIPLLEIDYDMSQSHNPVRLRGCDAMAGPRAQELLAPATVVISENDVIQVATDLAPQYPAARRSIAPAPQ